MAREVYGEEQTRHSRGKHAFQITESRATNICGSNVPGVALYMTGLTQLRALMASSPYFSSLHAEPSTQARITSTLPKLNGKGNILAGATMRVAVGFILNPVTVVKARFESNLHSYGSVAGALATLIRQGPSELFRGFLPSAMRDAPYAGLFVFFYEGIKRRAGVRTSCSLITS
jgi:solute carrier family 25 protein 38